MTTELFNLSEKIINIKQLRIPIYGMAETSTELCGNKEIVGIEDVKEAIRLIKLNPDKIDKIVGDKLI